ncbi:hypothetical protein BOX15_Mlig008682g2, partial [Macrostomum lignano]
PEIDNTINISVTRALCPPIGFWTSIVVSSTAPDFAMRQIVLLLLGLAVAQASVTVTRTSSNELHPSAMEMEVQLPSSNKKVRIPLNKTQDFENVPVTVTENGLSMTFSARQIHHPSHAHYRDIESKSVISVRHVNGKRRISGHVMHEGTSYFLEPLGDADHQVTMNALNPHDLAKKVNVARDIESRKKRQTNTASTNYKVEIYLLIDSRVWSAFKSIYSTDSAALTELHFYYTHILNGIDTSYRNIGSPSISVSCIGMTISKTLADDKWMAGEDTEGSNILSAMKNYIVGKTADHFMAFTRMDITGGGSSSVCGMAYVGGVCRNIRVSINEDQGLQSWGTAAHELAHNLGSHHDASGNTCSSGAKNLMSPSGGMYNLANVANSYRFSSCSVSYMAAYLNSLGSTNCMTSDQGSRLSELTSNTREGTRLTLDQVCRFFQPNGPGKFYLTTDTFNNPASICAMIYCASSDGGGTSVSGLRAPVGTPCGNKKSCNWNGECSADESAPAADDSCFWGDSWSNCADWKMYIEKGWTSCTDSAKEGCCRSLATLC